jgi:hypothetical protein
MNADREVDSLTGEAKTEIRLALEERRARILRFLQEEAREAGSSTS